MLTWQIKLIDSSVRPDSCDVSGRTFSCVKTPDLRTTWQISGVTCVENVLMRTGRGRFSFFPLTLMFVFSLTPVFRFPCHP